jgi:hypothetical protein
VLVRPGQGGAVVRVELKRKQARATLPQDR